MPREKAVDVRLFAKIEVLGKQLDQTYGARHLVTTTFEQSAPIEVASWPFTLGIFWLAGIVPFYA